MSRYKLPELTLMAAHLNRVRNFTCPLKRLVIL